MTVMDEKKNSAVAGLPAIVDMAKHYQLDAAAFVHTFKTVAMPANASNAEFVSCCLVAREHGLNPLTKEIYFMRTKSGAIQAIVSVDGWIKKANEHPAFDGMELRDDRDDKGNLTGMFCTIYRKDRAHPTTIREDLKECQTAGGPVWKTSPYRMMRNRVICQAVRIAFGFAGVMEPDEFAAWQGQGAPRDITPAAPLPELPDIPDVAPAPAVVEAEIVDDAPLADPEGFVAKLREDIETCNSMEELEEVRAANADLIARLPVKLKRQAEKMFTEVE